MYRYTRLAVQMVKSDKNSELTAVAESATKTGTVMNFVAMGLAMIGGEQIVGSLVAESLSRGNIIASKAGFVDTGAIMTLKAFVLQSNTNALVAAFIGLLTSWYINRIALMKGKTPLQQMA